VRTANRNTEAEAILRASLWGVGPGCGDVDWDRYLFETVVEVTLCELLGLRA
jgi:hypothetical protein